MLFPPVSLWWLRESLASYVLAAPPWRTWCVNTDNLSVGNKAICYRPSRDRGDIAIWHQLQFYSSAVAWDSQTRAGTGKCGTTVIFCLACGVAWGKEGSKEIPVQNRLHCAFLETSELVLLDCSLGQQWCCDICMTRAGLEFVSPMLWSHPGVVLETETLPCYHFSKNTALGRGKDWTVCLWNVRAFYLCSPGVLEELLKWHMSRSYVKTSGLTWCSGFGCGHCCSLLTGQACLCRFLPEL